MNADERRPGDQWAAPRGENEHGRTDAPAGRPGEPYTEPYTAPGHAAGPEHYAAPYRPDHGYGQQQPPGQHPGHRHQPYGQPHEGPRPASWGPAPGQASSAHGPGGTDRGRGRRGPGWGGVAAVAAGAAVLASLGTAGLTGAWDGETAASPAASASAPATTGTEAAPVVTAQGETPDWTAVAEAVRPSVVAIDVRTAAGAGAGSGVILDAEGHVLTNDHVVGDAVDGGIVVTLADGRMYQASIAGTDPATDLAVITLTDPPDDLSPATVGSSGAVVVGDPVVAVGNPLGLSSTVTTGIVSAVDRPVSTQEPATQPGQRPTRVVTNAIQVDAAINPGNSGGPLFDDSGRVIGITSSIASLSSGGGQAGSIGLGFAIPIDLASQIADQLIENGVAEHAFLGVSLSDGTATADGTTRAGAKVEQVEPGSPAAGADLQAGDVITAIDDQPVTGAESLTGFVRQYAKGEKVTLTVVRDGAGSTVTATLASREDQGF